MKNFYTTLLILSHFKTHYLIYHNSINLTRNLYFKHFLELPDPPRNLLAYNATAQSVCLRWEPPIFVDEGKRYWYTISYKTRTPQRRQTVTVIDFVNQTSYEVTNLKSFTLYEFSVMTTTRFGSSIAIKGW